MPPATSNLMVNHNTFWSSRSRLVTVTALLAVVGWVAGCDFPERPPLTVNDIRTDSPQVEATAAEAEEALAEAPGYRLEDPWETWEAYFIGSRQLGFKHVRADRPEETSDARYRVKEVLVFRQGNSTFVQRLTQSSLESAEGDFRSFESELQVGPSITRFVGTRDQTHLTVETLRGTSNATDRIEWEPQFHGLVAIERSLLNRPMKTREERRQLRMLLPVHYEMATARLLCVGEASVPMLDGQQRTLTEIDCQIRFQENVIATVLWTDDQGQVLRTYSPALNMVHLPYRRGDCDPWVRARLSRCPRSRRSQLPGEGGVGTPERSATGCFQAHAHGPRPPRWQATRDDARRRDNMFARCRMDPIKSSSAGEARKFAPDSRLMQSSRLTPIARPTDSWIRVRT